MAEFTEVITAAGGGTFTSAITDGVGSIYFDTSPDYNFTTDSGFDNGDVILSGAIVGGDSVTLPAAGTGFAQVSLVIDAQNSAIFGPDIALASGIFTLALNSSASVGVTSVHGLGLAAGDLLLGADGSLELQPVPVPAAVWLLGSALIGTASIRRVAKT